MKMETLYEFLIRNKDKIEYVNLTWTYSEERTVDTRFVTKNGYPVYMMFDCTILDWEYCCRMDIEQAIEYSCNYGQWDGLVEDSDIYEGVLEKTYDNYNPEYKYHPKDLDPNDSDIICITYIGYGKYYDGDHTTALRKDEIETMVDADTYYGREDDPDGRTGKTEKD